MKIPIRIPPSDIVILSATASSVLDDNVKNHGPERAYKGIAEITKEFYSSSVEKAHHWLQFHIRRVWLTGVFVILRKEPGAGKYFKNVQLRAGSDSSPLGNPIVGYFPGPSNDQGSHFIPFVGVAADYVTFYMPMVAEVTTLQVDGVTFITGAKGQ